ncbi:MAG: tyrosine-type recombinase/integrase [Chloroflexi bacterium]|nr:tyrosine-type recombinase/integrase [Chloroflexota bacterium]
MRTAKAAAAFLVYCQYRDLRPKTMESYRWALRHLESHWEDLPTDSRQLLPVVGNRRLALESRRDLRRLLGRFFWWANQEFEVPDPTLALERLPRKKILPRVLTPDEVVTLWASCTTDRERGMVAVVLDCGARLGEVAGLVKGDLGPGYMRVSGKTGERQVPLSPSVQKLLQSLGDSQHIWMGRRGPMTRNGLQRTYQDLFKRSGLTGRKLGPHLLRHTFGTFYCRAGGNVRILQEIMGHQDLETTMIYVNLAGRDVAVDHARFSPITTLELVA